MRFPQRLVPSAICIASVVGCGTSSDVDGTGHTGTSGSAGTKAVAGSAGTAGGAGRAEATGGVGGVGVSGGTDSGGAAGAGGDDGGGNADAGGQNASGGTAGIACSPLRTGIELAIKANAAHDVRILHDTAFSATSATGIGVDGSYFYFLAQDALPQVHLFRDPVDGGVEEDLGVAPAVLGAKVQGAQLFWVENDSEKTAQLIKSAPITDLSSTTTLTSASLSSWDFALDDAAVYYAITSPASVYRVPLAAGSPSLVLTDTVVSIALRGDDLYYLDLESLGRVPKSGGTGAFLASASLNSGPLIADDNGVYWGGLDPVDYPLNRWTDGANQATVIDRGSDLTHAPTLLASDTNHVYWLDGSFCGTLHRVAEDGTEAEIWDDGFRSASYVGATNGHVFVVDTQGVYELDEQ